MSDISVPDDVQKEFDEKLDAYINSLLTALGKRFPKQKTVGDLFGKSE